MNRILLFLCLMICIGHAEAQKSFFDNFDSYTAGNYVAKSNSKWTTWSGSPGSSEDVLVDTMDSYSGKNSLYLSSTSASGGPQDLVLPFGGVHAEGMFYYSMRMKVPSGKSAYFNFQGFSTWPTTGGWTTEVNFTTSGSLTFNNTTSSSKTFTTSYKQNTWFTLKMIINLTANRWDVYIDNVHKGSFSTSLNQISAIDLFPSDADASFWVDDVFYSVPAAANDAGVVAIDSPATYCSSSQRNVVAKIRNYGAKVISSGVTVNWSVNGKLQTAVKYTGSIDTLNGSKPITANVTLGKYTFSGTADTVKVWTTLPNGVKDTINMNDTFVVIKKPTPLPLADAGDDKEVCLGSKVRIGTFAASGHRYSWTSKPAGFTATSFNADVSPTENTMYYLTVTSNATGCSSVDSVYVTVKPAAEALVAKDTSVCAGDSVQIGSSNMDPSMAFSWTSSPSGFTSTLANPWVKPSATTTYKLTVINKHLCSDDATMKVTVMPLPNALAGVDKTICKGESVQIGWPSVSGSTYSWRSVPLGFSSDAANPTVKPNDTTKYFVMVTNANGCSREDEMIVNVVPLPVANAGSDTSICVGGSVFIGAPSKPGHTYTWTSKPAGFNSFLANPTVKPTVTTTYKVIMKNSSGCTGEDSVVVRVVPMPVFNAGTAKSICPGESVTLGSTAVDGLTYQWSSTPSGFTSTDANPVVKPTENTTYKVVATNSTGCSTTSQVTISVNPRPVANAGTGKTICPGSSAEIGSPAVTGYTYSWSSNPSGFTSNEANPTVTPGGTTTYKVIVTNTEGCQAESEVTVNVSLPNADYTATGTGLWVTFKAANISYKKYEWNFRDGNTDTGRSLVHKFPAPGSYKVKLTVTRAEGCTQVKDSTINVTVSSINTEESAVSHINIYPNPFNQATTLTYTLQKRAQVSIELLDVTGKKAGELLNTKQPAGDYTLQVNADKFDLKPGVYFIQMQVDGQATSRKIIRIE